MLVEMLLNGSANISWREFPVSFALADEKSEIQSQNNYKMSRITK